MFKRWPSDERTNLLRSNLASIGIEVLDKVLALCISEHGYRHVICLDTIGVDAMCVHITVGHVAEFVIWLSCGQARDVIGAWARTTVLSESEAPEYCSIGQVQEFGVFEFTNYALVVDMTRVK